MNVHSDSFDHVAAEYDASLAAHITSHYLRKRVSFIAARKANATTALDVGCGTGVLTHALSQIGLRVTGVDLSVGMLRVMQGRYDRAIQADALQLPFPEGAFDIVYTVATLHHIAEPAAIHQTTREMTRVCRAGGIVIVWDHNTRNPYWPIIMRRVPQDTGAERIPSTDELIAAFAALPEAVVTEVHYLGFVPDFVPPSFLPVFVGLERIIESVPGLGRLLAAHNVVIVRKSDPEATSVS
ncbi:MAG: class I SAM-dependent methyltransferase [Chloroflexi bacterium]|nr:class I SAM-dependent methyltransferase [Chloroflexota bacterium]